MGRVRSGSHVAALDGLRGVAAAVVVLHHWFNALAMPREARRVLFEGVLAPFVNGQGAVVLFFVLSGTVLAASLARGRAPVDWPVFYAKRVFRIHPPYLFALLVAWVASFFYLREFGAERGLTHVMWQMAQVHLAPLAGAAPLPRADLVLALPAAPANPAPAGAPWRRDSVRGRWSPMPRMPIECAAR